MQNHLYPTVFASPSPQVFNKTAAKMRKTEQSALPKYYFPSSKPDPNPNWRIQIKQTQLISQTSTILLQRHTKLWTPLLKKPLKLTSNFTPSIFIQILNKIQTHPEICFNFFNWTKKILDFKPDLKVNCELTRILFGSEMSEHGKPILDSVVKDHPPSKIVPLLMQSSKGASFMCISPVLDCLVEYYCSKNMYLNGLEVYQMGKLYGAGLGVDSCNAILNLLSDRKELRLAWCFYGSMIRNGVSGDELTWSVIVRILCKDGKFQRVSRILDLGICTPAMFDSLIEGYSKRGDFGGAFCYLNEMCGKRFEPSFGTYSSMLDGACKYQDKEMIGNVLCIMVEKGYLSEPCLYDYDSIIEKLCNLGRTYAVDMFFKRACDEKIKLNDATYECMLRALLSEEGRVKDAIELYDDLHEKNVVLNESCYNEFVIVLCKEDPSERVSKLLVDIVNGGFSSAISELSHYIRRLCADRRWREAEKLVDLVLDRGCLLDSLSCGSIMRRYCSSRRINAAIILHDKLEGLEGTLDGATYNVFLAALFKDKRIEEVMKVFDNMRTCNMLSSESFSIMIRGLCQQKELRKAMKLHDEMLELGLKPDKRSYTKLISGFK